MRRERLAWPDVAKGISILGVVMLHISLAVPEAEDTWLASVNQWIDPLRMPLFFLVSGFFSVKVLQFSFRELMSRRLWFFLVPYLIWVPVELYTNRIANVWAFDSPRLTWADLAYNLALGHNMGWFLHALIVFNLVLWATRKLPRWAAFALSFVSVLLVNWHDTYYFVGKALMFLPVFIAGCHLRSVIYNYADRVDEVLRKRTLPAATAALLAVAVVLYGVGFAIRRFFDLYEGPLMVASPLPGGEFLERGEFILMVRLVEQLAMLPLAIACAVLIARIPVVSSALRFVGRRTLPVYLGHPIALTVGFTFYRVLQEPEISMNGQTVLTHSWFWVIYCIIITGLGSLALWGLTKVPILRWTLTPPALGNIRSKVIEPMVSGATEKLPAKVKQSRFGPGGSH